MALRPSAARWFEIVVPREDAHDAVEALARRGQVQFEWLGTQGATSEPQLLHEPVARYRALARDYGHFWPAPVFERRCCTMPVETSAKVALHQIGHWQNAAAGPLGALGAARSELEAMQDWAPVLRALAGTCLDLGALARAGPVLACYCLVLPAPAQAQTKAQTKAPDPGSQPRLELPLGLGAAFIGILPRPELGRLCLEGQAAGGRCLTIPDWLQGDAAACLAALPGRRARTEARIADLEAQLRRLALEHGVDRASGVLERLDWFQTTAQGIACDGHTCWVTGWTSEASPEVMNDALRDSGVRASVAFIDPPVDAASPSVTHNPSWLKPFEVFTQAMGVPSATETDPTPWVAVLVSLMFGYMCGDVGHGALILLAGLWLRRRNPLWPLLVVCGASAMLFGVAYGDVFGFSGLVGPLWLSPLDDPMMVLLIPVLGGALVMTLGIVLHAVQTCWRVDGGAQRVADLAQLMVYWGLSLALWRPEFGWLIWAGVALCVANRLWWSRTLGSLGSGLGALAEGTFSLLINTLSFARVGAFALAHTALEGAVMGVADLFDHPIPSAMVIILGNLAVVLVEGVVVMIQTTRLILFEFFVRFFEGHGRAFRPTESPGFGEGKARGKSGGTDHQA